MTIREAVPVSHDRYDLAPPPNRSPFRGFLSTKGLQRSITNRTLQFLKRRAVNLPLYRSLLEKSLGLPVHAPGGQLTGVPRDQRATAVTQRYFADRTPWWGVLRSYSEDYTETFFGIDWRQLDYLNPQTGLWEKRTYAFRSIQPLIESVFKLEFTNLPGMPALPDRLGDRNAQSHRFSAIGHGYFASGETYNQARQRGVVQQIGGRTIYRADIDPPAQPFQQRSEGVDGIYNLICVTFPGRLDSDGSRQPILPFQSTFEYPYSTNLNPRPAVSGHFLVEDSRLVAAYDEGEVEQLYTAQGFRLSRSLDTNLADKHDIVGRYTGPLDIDIIDSNLTIEGVQWSVLAAREVEPNVWSLVCRGGE